MVNITALVWCAVARDWVKPYSIQARNLTEATHGHNCNRDYVKGVKFNGEAQA